MNCIDCGNFILDKAYPVEDGAFVCEDCNEERLDFIRQEQAVDYMESEGLLITNSFDDD